jgi:hypothetical protein
MYTITDTAVWVEHEVEKLDCAGRLRWAGAINHANYYHEDTNGLFDGLAACLSELADRFDLVKSEEADSSFFIRETAEELWKLEGEARNWKDPNRLPLARSIANLVSALEIESRKIAPKM